MLRLYRVAAQIGAPLVRAYLARRLRQGKESPARFGERRGIPSLARPDGPLVWLHAASVGEAISALSLIERLMRDRPNLTLLVTTGSVTSADIMAARMPPGALHQFMPADLPGWIGRFLDHWRPDLALWMESEFWPITLTALEARGVPVLLVNARISDRSFRGWRRVPGTIARLLGCFALCLAQSETDAERLRALGAGRVVVPGNLKFAATPLPAPEAPLAELRAAIGARPVWIAASTHAGEEDAIARAQRVVRGGDRPALCIIVPRHPARGPAVAAALTDAGLRVARRAEGGRPDTGTDVYVADTMGELGLFYRLADCAFIGGSLVPHGGQNPLEAAKLGCALLYGPHMENFAAIDAELRDAGGAVALADADALGPAVAGLLADDARRAVLVEAGRRVADAKTGILDAVMTAIGPFLDAAEADAGHARPCA